MQKQVDATGVVLASETDVKYKIIYHVGEEINLKTKVAGGTLTWQEHSLLIDGAPSIEIPFASMISVELFRLHGLGRMLKLVCREQTIFLSVVRFNIAGYFVTVNFFKTGELLDRLKAQIQS